MTKKTETRTLNAHNKLLFDVIRRQAGTLSKAILEGIMNSVDAKATECRITLLPKRCVIVDDGQGFRSREEIENWFEVFGQPHDESEGKVYGTFRMGRGQMFAFGKNTWLTGTFQMAVDIQGRGLEYDLATELKNQKGCEITIDLYDQLMPADLDECLRDLELWVKWAPIPIYFNDERLSQDPQSHKWDEETTEAYIKLKPTGDLAVYNLGVHVLSFANWKFGTGGEVVSKKQLRVNFARNDIQSDCAVWKKVKGVVDQKASAKVVGKKALSDGERQRIADRMLQRTHEFDTDVRVVTAVTGRHYGLGALTSRHEWPQLTVANKGCRKGDKIHKQKIAFVLAAETLERFHSKTVESFIDKVARLVKHDWQRKLWEDIRIADFDELTKGLSDKYDILEDVEYTSVEMLWFQLMQAGITDLVCEDKRAAWRKLQIGHSDTANGWTDGETYIAVGRQFLKRLKFNLAGFTALGKLLLHEMCHHEPDLVEHDHDQAFYEEFHDNAASIGEFVERIVRGLPGICKTLKQRMTKMQVHTINKAAIAEKAADDLITQFPNVSFKR